MAVTLLCGFEMGSLGELFAATSGGALSVGSAIKRSGTYALKVQTTANSADATFKAIAAGGTNRTIFKSVRLYIYIVTSPSGNVFFWNDDNTLTLSISAGAISVNSGTADVYIDGSLEISGTGTSGAMSLDAWHCVNIISGLSADTIVHIGLTGISTAEYYVDDIVFSDSNEVIGPGNQFLLLPTSDPASLNSWTNGGGGTTSIFEGVNNIPPTGSAASTNGIKIKNGATGSNLDYVATMQTYTVAGVPSDATVNAVMAICNDGEAVSTGTKAGAVWIASNPSGQSPQTFDYGDDSGALGTFPTGWKTHYGPVTSSPSVTLGTAPTVTVRKTGSTNREVAVDFLGLYVDYTPSSGFIPVDPFGMMGMFGI